MIGRVTRTGGVSELFRSASVYGASNVLERLIPVLLLPLLTFYLTAADVGMIAVFTAVAGIATPLVGMNITYAVRRRYFDADPADFAAYVGNSLMMLAAASGLALLLVALLRGPLTTMSGLPAVWFAAAIAAAAVHEFLAVPLTIWQVQHRAERYAWVQISRSAALTVLTAIFVVTLGLGWQGAALATILTAAGFAIAIGIPALRQVTFRYDRADIAHALRYGGGLIPHVLGTQGIKSADRFIIAYYVGASDNGLYWVAYQIGLAVSVVADAFNRAWSPWLFAALKEDDGRTDRRIVLMMYGYFAGIAALALVLSAAAPAVIRVVLAPEFHEAGRFVAWLTVGFAFNAFYMVVSGVVFYSERTMIVSSITGATVVLNVGLNLVLVPAFGAIGAAHAAAAAFAAKFFLTWFAAQRVRPLPWRLSRARTRTHQVTEHNVPVP